VLHLAPTQIDRAVTSLTGRLQDLAPAPLVGAETVLTGLATAALTIAIFFLMLSNGARMGRSIVGVFPTVYRRRAEVGAQTAWTTLTSYARGVVVVAAADALGVGITLVVLGVPLVLPLAILTFLSAFIPIIGATLAGVVTVLVALVAKGPITALIVLGAILLVQQLEGNVLYPVIMGNNLQLSAFAVLLAVSAGTLIGGILGAVVGVPVVAVVYRVWLTVRDADSGLSRTNGTAPQDEPNPRASVAVGDGE